MKKLSINIPDNVDLNPKDIAILIAAILYEKGKLTLGQAAKMAGLSKKLFAESLANYNVSIFNFPATDLASDVKNA